MTVAISERRGEPVAASRPTVWWGMILVVATEATLFALLLVSYLYLRWRAEAGWPPDGLADPKLLRPGLATAILVASSAPMLLAARAAAGARRPLALVLLAVSLALAVGFLVFQGFLLDASADLFRPQDHAYGSIFYALIGLHAAHVVAGALLALWAILRIALRPLSPVAAVTVRVTALYWHFVNVVALAVYVVLYLTPRL